jgi:hypothetical protein
MKKTITIERHKAGITLRVGNYRNRVKQETLDADDMVIEGMVRTIRCPTFDKPIPFPPNQKPKSTYRSRFLYFLSEK